MWYRTAQVLPLLLEILDLGGVGGGTIEGQVDDLILRDGHVEAPAEVANRVGIQLLLLVGDVEALCRLAQAVALDCVAEDDGGLSGMLHGRIKGGEDLQRIVSAAAEMVDFVVAQVADHAQQLGVLAEEVLADVVAAFDDVLLVLAVNDFEHAFEQLALLVLGQDRVPVAAPDDFDHVPTRSTEGGLQLLDDLAIATDGTIETLQVAVDHKDEVVEFLAGGQCDGPEGLWLVGLTIAEEGPHLLVAACLQTAVFQILDIAGVVDGCNGTDAHGDGGKLPEGGHQPRVRIGGETTLIAEFPPEVGQIVFIEPSFEKGAGVDTGRGMPLKVDQIAGMVVAGGAEEVVEAHLVERRGRGVGGDVPTDAVFALVGAHNHGHGVVADQTADALFQLQIAGVGGLFGQSNRVDVGGVGGKGDVHARLLGM